jgi:hypothetical protein
MILVRDVFRLKFGKARDALAAFKEASAGWVCAHVGCAARQTPGAGCHRSIARSSATSEYWNSWAPRERCADTRR